MYDPSLAMGCLEQALLLSALLDETLLRLLQHPFLSPIRSNGYVRDGHAAMRAMSSIEWELFRAGGPACRKGDFLQVS